MFNMNKQQGFVLRTNKKGLLKKEVLKFIIAAICLFLLVVYVLVPLVKMFVIPKEIRQAESILKEIVSKANSLKSIGESESVILAGPKGWYLYRGKEKEICAICKSTEKVTCPKESKRCNLALKRDINVIEGEISIYLTEITLKLNKDGDKEIVDIAEKKSH